MRKTGTLAIISLLIIACTDSKNNGLQTGYVYKPDDKALYDTIVSLDSIFFGYYNSCNMNLDKYAAFYSDSLEFYHDKSGLDTSKQNVVNRTRENICGKVTRELVPGSIEVYPIKDYGAVEMGLHRFHNHTEKEVTPPHASKFVLLWQHGIKGWKITRVISLH